MGRAHKTRAVLIGSGAVLVALVATAFAVGGSAHTATTNAAVSATASVAMPARAPHKAVGLGSAGGGAGAGVASAGGSVAAPVSAPLSSGPAVDATRIVKTGELAIRVAKQDLQAKADALVRLATAEGGYVAQSSTELGGGAPSSEVVLRIPVAHFEDAIRAASGLGVHVLSLTTSADDVTGQYVDLTARLRALEQTRSTYLTILSRARTIGETLAVQQRVDDVQQQIDQLKGRIKLLANQSSYSTLTVDLVPAGGVTPLHHARRDGLGAAWHRSWSRFDRGVNAIVAAIGPIVFALLLLGLVGLIGLFGYRGVRRVVSRSHAAA